jgi:hypothetical protein
MRSWRASHVFVIESLIQESSCCGADDARDVLLAGQILGQHHVARGRAVADLDLRDPGEASGSPILPAGRLKSNIKLYWARQSAIVSYQRTLHRRILRGSDNFDLVVTGRRHIGGTPT